MRDGSVRTLWPEASAPEIQLLMDLRGTNKREQTEALDQLGLKPDLPAHAGTDVFRRGRGCMKDEDAEYEGLWCLYLVCPSAAAISVKGIVGRFQSGPFAFLKK